MTLILTEVSELGIAMAADSLISKMDDKGKIVGYAHWRKLLKVRRIKAAISYWGSVGSIGKKIRFDDWLEKKIEGGKYTDLSSLADYLAAEMNHAARDQPLSNDKQAGIHVAGIQRWNDGVLRPTLYHVHNGDSQPVLRLGQNGTIEIFPNSSPRELFTKHNDFSDGNPDRNGLIELLKTGGKSVYLRNGDFVPFHIISEGLDTIFQNLHKIPEISAHQKSQTLGKRIGYLKSVIGISTSIYKLSSLSSTGGEVLTVGIKPDGSYWN
jgi:hypothetical protein